MVRISYEIDLPTSSGKVRLRFEDVIERRTDGMIVNRAIVSKFGLPLGDVDLVFSASRSEFLARFIAKFR